MFMCCIILVIGQFVPMRNGEKFQDFLCIMHHHWVYIKNVHTNRFRTINYNRFRAQNITAKILLCDSRCDSDKKITSVLVGRIILSTFNPIENHCKMQVNHKDGNIYNNKLNNLEWVTQKENIQHAIKLGIFKRHQVEIKLTHVQSGQMYQFESLKACGQFCKENDIGFVNSSPKRKVVKNGYKFEYMDDSKYDTKVRNLDDEEWKQFHIGTWNHKYFVSNFGRIKYVKPDGTETLR
eukprot:106963_1